MALFEVVTDVFCDQIGKDTPHQVPSHKQAKNYHLYSVVVKKTSENIFKKPDFKTSEFALHDLVEKNEEAKKKFDELKVEDISIGDIAEHNFFKLKRRRGGKLKKEFTTDLSAYKSVFVQTDLKKVHKKEVNTPELLELVKQLKLNQDHEFVKSVSKDRSKVLCLIYGEWQGTEGSTATASLSQGLEARGRVGSAMHGKVQLDKSSKIDLKIEKCTPLAYKVHELTVNYDGSMTFDPEQNAKGEFKGPGIEAIKESQKGSKALSEKEKKELKVHTLRLCSVPWDVLNVSALLDGAQIRWYEEVPDHDLQLVFQLIELKHDAKAVLTMAGFTFQDYKIIWPKASSDTLVSIAHLFDALGVLFEGALECLAEIDDVTAKVLNYVLGIVAFTEVTKSDPRAKLIFEDSKDGKAAREFLEELGAYTDLGAGKLIAGDKYDAERGMIAQFVLQYIFEI